MRTMRAAATFASFLLVISTRNTFGQSGPSDECALTAQMDIYSNAQVSKVTGDVSGFELALDKPEVSQRQALLFVYEGAANTDGIPLTATMDGNNWTIEGTWVEHLTEYPSKKDIVQKHFVRITGALNPKVFRGTISIEGLQIVNPERMLLKRGKQIWVCRSTSPVRQRKNHD